MEPYDVFVRWERGEPYEEAVSVDAADPEMALTLAKANIDLRRDPVSVKVAPQSAVTETTETEPAISPTTDREYRKVQWYAENKVEVND